MPGNQFSDGPKSGLSPLPPWAIVSIFLVILGISWWQTHSNPAPAGGNQQASSRSDSSRDEEDETDPAVSVEVATEPSEQPALGGKPQPAPHPGAPKQGSHTPAPGASDKKAQHSAQSVQIENQSIRNQDGRVVFQGTVDLQPTLDRIRRGDQNAHRNDGTTFQNRERRLPQKPAGYYKEYVHPTHGISGPGPQRIILGKDGDEWYTPDHYKSFRRLPPFVE